MLWVDYNNYLLKYYYDYDMMLIKYSINLGLLLKMRNQSRRSPLSPYNSKINSILEKFDLIRQISNVT